MYVKWRLTCSKLTTTELSDPLWKRGLVWFFKKWYIVRLHNFFRKINNDAYFSFTKNAYLCFDISSVVEFQLWWVLKSKIFAQKSTYSSILSILKGNHCILRIQGAPVRQKLGMILENKVVQKLKLEKNVFYKKMIS